MKRIEETLAAMHRAPQAIRFGDLCLVCNHFFGTPRQAASSHRVYKTPWPGDPRVNIQSSKGMAKAYQVRQVLAAIEKLQAGSEGRVQ
mgnify:CR=1 FL=1